MLEADPKAKTNRHHEIFLKHWWRLSYERENMISAIDNLSRYISCGQVTKRPIFEFISSEIRPNAACMVFAHDDDYSSGILQSSMHWLWFTNRCSTLKADFRYTSNSVFDTFPWPQKPSAKAVRALAGSAVAFRKKRNELRAKHNLSLRELYQAMDAPGDHPLKKAQAELDAAVRKAYGASASADVLEFLLELNAMVAAAEENGDPVQKPGLPALINDHNAFVTDDFLEP